MSKRQANYLSIYPERPGPAPAASGDASPAPPLPEPPPRPVRTTLLDRESALARLATGQVKQVTQLLLDPARVRIWPGNARHQASLTEENCRDLIDSIVAEGGQKVPVVVRRVGDDPAYDYELIAGTRRHWSISWLRANNYPETQLLAQVQNLDNESAFRLADLENRARRDVSDFERARNYREALQSYYGDRQNRMAERLNLSKGWLSKMLTVAALPDWAVAAYASPADIQLKVCYALAQRLAALAEDAPKALKKAKAEAEVIAADQAKRRKAGARRPFRRADVYQAPAARRPRDDSAWSRRSSRCSAPTQPTAAPRFLSCPPTATARPCASMRDRAPATRRSSPWWLTP